jgi:sulfur carrier protein ThiS
MKIEVKLHGTLRRYRPSDAGGAPHHPFSISVPESLTIAELATQLNIPDGLVNAASINSEVVTPDVVLPDGAIVQLFPPSAGG